MTNRDARIPGGPVNSNELPALPQFPRSAGYDVRWVIDNVMGPNVLWLTEFLTEAMTLRPGMRLLDMGCGRAVSSIFLAREFEARVWATDLWIDASDNMRRVRDAGLSDRVMPVHAEAHALPFADDFFAAAVSMDAYHYFGTDDLYLGQFVRFIEPEGEIGIIVPGLRSELGVDVPEHLAPFWQWEFCSLHSVAWWRHHWSKTGLVDVTVADWMPDGWRYWQLWSEVCFAETGNEMAGAEADMVRIDAGRNLGFVRLVARRRAKPRYAR